MSVTISKSKSILCALLLALPLSVQATEGPRLKGRITGSQNEKLEYVNVYLKNTTHHTTTNAEGAYALTAPKGEYTLVAQMIGYQPFEQRIKLEAERLLEINISLQEDRVMLEEVIITAKSAVKQVQETAYNVVAIDAKSLHNTNLNLSGALDRISGVKIKETGGVGSDTQIALNGLSGKHVKIFMDGVPMNTAGSAMQIGNIPIGLAERIEVYKGVVPVELGADALGGAINIVTQKTVRNTFVDASYAFGSFNTHKTNISLGHTSKSGYVVQLNAYQNYSDNSYKVKTNLLNLETNTYSKEEYWFKRFHDTYHNEAIIAKVGIVNRPWATHLMLEATLSREHADIQNANLMKIVYGGKERRAKSFMPALTYRMRDLFTPGLSFALSAGYNKTQTNNIDTLARQYNWNGDYRPKASKGESSYSLSKSNNHNTHLTANLRYSPEGKHSLSLNNTLNSFGRQTNDNLANSDNVTEATFMKRKTTKNILGLAYKFLPNQRWNLSAFAKHYHVRVTGPVDVSSGTTAEYELQNRQYNTTGYGAAATYLMPRGLQLKASYEHAYRLPTVNELFGDEVLETGDATLKPEDSHNLNLNLSYDQTFAHGHAVSLNLGFVYRDTRNYIRRQIEQRYGGTYYTNHGRVQNVGMDLEVRYFYGKSFTLGGSFTRQQITNRERYAVTGQELVYYKDRMPNVPYLFANADASYHLHNAWGKGNTLSAGYNLQYIHSFFRNWESEGGDIIIPTQLSHDVTLNYSMTRGRYNIALEAKNITNELLYDNYSLQKPGRSFYVKLRYHFSQNK